MASFLETWNTVYRDYVTDGVPSSGKHYVTKADVRALGLAMANYVDGVSQTAVMVTKLGRRLESDPIASVSIDIDTVFQTPDAATISVKTTKPHGYATGTSLRVNISGWHGVTERAHPAHGTFTVTKVDGTTLVLQGSTWVPDSEFLSGHVWKPADLVDARPEITRLLAAALEDGGGVLTAPDAHLALLSKETTNYCVSVPPNTTIVGNATLWLGDGVYAHMLRVAGNNVSIQLDRLKGNRREQPSTGRHLVIIGVDGATIEDCHLKIRKYQEASGYCIGGQGDSAFVRPHIEGGDIEESYPDGIDFKNRLNKNFGGVLEGLHFAAFSCGLRGLNYAPSALGADPFTMTSGSSQVVVAWPNNFHVGIPVTFAGAPADIHGINVNGTARIVAVGPTSFTVDFSPQVATSSGTGGGSGVQQYATDFVSAKTGIDIRGRGFVVRNITARCDTYDRHVVRGRPGGPLDDDGEAALNGEGAVGCLFEGIDAVNTGRQVGGYAVACGGRDNVVRDVKARLMRAAVLTVRSADNITVSEARAETCGSAANLNANNSRITASTAKGCTIGFNVDGVYEPDWISLPSGALSMTAGVDRITVHAPEHGAFVGRLFDLGGAPRLNNVRFNHRNIAVYEVIDDDHFTYQTGVIPESDVVDGGGDYAQYAWNDVVNSADNVTVSGCQSIDATDTHFYIGALTGLTTVTGCDYSGIGKPLTNLTGDTFIDCWFAKVRPVKTLPADGTLTPLTVQDLQYTIVVPANATAPAAVVMPAPADCGVGCADVTFVVLAQGLTIAGYGAKIQAGPGLNETVVVTEDAGASLTLSLVSLGQWSATKVVGTWDSFDWDPTDLGAKLKGFLDFEDNSKLTIVSSAVSAIADSVTGSSWAQGTSSSRPALVTSTQTGRQVAKFDGVDDNLAIAPVPGGYPLTGAFEWWRIGTQDALTSDSGDRRSLSMGSAGANWLAIGRRRSGGGNNQAFAETSNVRSLAPVNAPPQFFGPHIVRAIWDGTNQGLVFDGVLGQTVAVTQSGNNTRARLGAGAGTSPSSFQNGETSAGLITDPLAGADEANTYIWSLIRLGL